MYSTESISCKNILFYSGEPEKLIEQLKTQCLHRTVKCYRTVYNVKDSALTCIQSLTDVQIKNLMNYFNNQINDRKLNFKNSGQVNCNTANLLLYPLISAMSITRFDPKFNDYQVLLKDAGKCYGFILENKNTGHKYYAKMTKDIESDYFYNCCLLNLGIKAPEAMIIEDMNSIKWLATQDMQRNYKKCEQIKDKQFQIIALMFNCVIESIWDPTEHKMAATKMHDTHGILSEEQVKTRISFIKIMIATYVFGISDVFTYGNLGVLEYARDGEIKRKFSLIDFDSVLQNSNDLSLAIATKEYYNDAADNIFALFVRRDCYASFFCHIFSQFTQKEISQAITSLYRPKNRSLSESGYSLTDKTSSTLQECIEKVCREVSKVFPENIDWINRTGKQIITRFDDLMELETKLDI